LISRWRCACKAIVAPFSGYFGRVEGLAWNNNGEDVSNSNDRTLMSAMDAFTASAGFASLLQDCFGATFLDVDAGITQSVPGDPRPSVTVEDISLAADAQQGVFGRVIVIRGCIFSPRYHKGLMDRLDKLEFAYSPPAKKRLIRISGFREGLYFILGRNTLIEGVLFSDVEDEICYMGKFLMAKLTPLLKAHAESNNLRHNEDLEFDADLIQLTCASPKASAYGRHNDVNALICDSGSTGSHYPAQQVVVVTFVLGNDWPSSVKVYLVFLASDGQ
jgi:hypothetical protein